jgi:hypothetical protein
VHAPSQLGLRSTTQTAVAGTLGSSRIAPHMIEPNQCIGITFETLRKLCSSLS